MQINWIAAGIVVLLFLIIYYVGLAEKYRSCPPMRYHGYPIDCPNVPDLLVLNPFIWPYSGGYSPAEVLTTQKPKIVIEQPGEGSPEEAANVEAGEPREGFCGSCHDFTSDVAYRTCMCPIHNAVNSDLLLNKALHGYETDLLAV